MKTKSKQLDWYNNELTKDQIELNKEKNDFISQIKSLKKEDIIKQPKKLTFWQKLKKIILGY
jgi:hypothetical protein